MIVGIHQPNYLPGISYFCKILQSDTFIFLDSVQFSKGNWTNRNRIKSPQGELLLSIPVLTKGKSLQLISEMEIVHRNDWRKKNLKSIYQNYSKAPFFHDIIPIMEEIYSIEWENLSQMNCHIIKKLCNVLGINKEFHLASKLGGDDRRATDLLIFLVLQVGGDVYLSGQGGRKYMETEKFAAQRIELRFQEFTPVPYCQQHGGFIANLSIIDLLFNEGGDAVRIIRNSARML
jgi:hypothetical protein